MHHVLEYCVERKSCLILLDEIDVYASETAFMAEIRQIVDGACRIPPDALLVIVGTTNKDPGALPHDLLDRVLVEVPFTPCPKVMPRLYKGQAFFSREQCNAFWDRNARCLTTFERIRLATDSEGCTPRQLQMWAQKALILACHEATAFFGRHASTIKFQEVKRYEQPVTLKASFCSGCLRQFQQDISKDDDPTTSQRLLRQYEVDGVKPRYEHFHAAGRDFRNRLPASRL